MRAKQHAFASIIHIAQFNARAIRAGRRTGANGNKFPQRYAALPDGDLDLPRQLGGSRVEPRRSARIRAIIARNFVVQSNYCLADQIDADQLNEPFAVKQRDSQRSFYASVGQRFLNDGRKRKPQL